MRVRLGVFGPVIAGALVWAIVSGQVGAAGFVIAFGSGLLIWTAVEYLMHRFIFHSGFPAHWAHHEEPTEPKYILAPLLLSIPVAAALFGVLWLATRSSAHAGLMIAGVVSGYLAYEELHLRIHANVPGGPILRTLRRLHFYHHYADDSRCYGVTSPLWDIVLSSGVKPGQANVRPPETV